MGSAVRCGRCNAAATRRDVLVVGAAPNGWTSCREENMTNPERIYGYLVNNRGSFSCDDCLTKEVGLKRRQQVQPVTDTLRLTPGFERQQGHCSRCGHEKLVIRAKP